jgi:hypothetical protein
MFQERDYMSHDRSSKSDQIYNDSNSTPFRVPGFEADTNPIRPCFGLFISCEIDKPFYLPYLSICLIWIHIKFGFLD